MGASTKEVHGEERNRKTVTDHCPDAGYVDARTGEPIHVPLCSHTYTQTEKFCRNCGWVTCKGILGALICPGCTEQW